MGVGRLRHLQAELMRGAARDGSAVGTLGVVNDLLSRGVAPEVHAVAVSVAVELSQSLSICTGM